MSSRLAVVAVLVLVAGCGPSASSMKTEDLHGSWKRVRPDGSILALGFSQTEALYPQLHGRTSCFRTYSGDEAPLSQLGTYKVERQGDGTFLFQTLMWGYGSEESAGQFQTEILEFDGNRLVLLGSEGQPVELSRVEDGTFNSGKDQAPPPLWMLMLYTPTVAGAGVPQDQVGRQGLWAHDLRTGSLTRWVGVEEAAGQGIAGEMKRPSMVAWDGVHSWGLGNTGRLGANSSGWALWKDGQPSWLPFIDPQQRPMTVSLAGLAVSAGSYVVTASYSGHAGYWRDGVWHELRYPTDGEAGASVVLGAPVFRNGRFLAPGRYIAGSLGGMWKPFYLDDGELKELPLPEGAMAAEPFAVELVDGKVVVAGRAAMGTWNSYAPVLWTAGVPKVLGQPGAEASLDLLAVDGLNLYATCSACATHSLWRNGQSMDPWGAPQFVPGRVAIRDGMLWSVGNWSEPKNTEFGTFPLASAPAVSFSRLTSLGRTETASLRSVLPQALMLDWAAW